MFDQLFNCPETVARHQSAPLFELRVGFLQPCAASGSPRGTLRRKARELLVIIDQLHLQPEGSVPTEAIEAAGHRWAHRQPSHYKLKDAEQAKAHFISIARQWLGCLGRLQGPSVPPYLRLIEEFATHLHQDRGLSPLTIRSESGHVKEFLSRYCTGDRLLSQVSLQQIDQAIARKGSQDGCTRASLQS